MRVSDTTNNQTDAALLERLAIGDQKAFHSLIQKHLPFILRTAERMVQDPTSAEDIAQEVMVRLWKKAPVWKITGPAKLDTWLYRVTLNLCIDKYRERTHLPIEQFDFLEFDGKTALSKVHEKQIEQIIYKLFDSLSELQRMVIILSYYEGFSAPKIADILETTPGAVTQLLHRARNILKTKLIDLGIKGWINDKHG